MSYYPRMLYVVSIGLMLLCAACATAPEQVVDDYLIAMNKGDVASLMELLAPDAQYVKEDFETVAGREQIHSLAIWDSTMRTEYILSDYEQIADTVFFRCAEKNLWYQALALEELYYDRSFMVVDHRYIKEIHLVLAEESAQRYQAQLREMRHLLPDSIYQQFFQHGKLLRKGEIAQVWLAHMPVRRGR